MLESCKHALCKGNISITYGSGRDIRHFLRLRTGLQQQLIKSCLCVHLSLHGMLPDILNLHTSLHKLSNNNSAALCLPGSARHAS
jgi:hypothetical protein